MGVSWDMPGAHGVQGRVHGQTGSFHDEYKGKLEKKLPDTRRGGLPPGVNYGGHKGSQGPLMNEFVTAILEHRRPRVDVAQSLNMSVAGIVAHHSALRDGELLKIPQYSLPNDAS